MDSRLLLPLLAFSLVLATGLLLQPRLASRRTHVRRRLNDHAVPVIVETGRQIERINVLKESAYGSGASLEKLLRRFPPARTAEHELRFADVDLGVFRYLLLRLVVAATAGLALHVAFGSPLIAAVGVVGGLMAPRLIVRRTAAKRRTAFEAQLAEAIDLMVGALKAGHGFLQAIESSATELKDPIKRELQRTVEQVNVGGSVVDALQDLTQRIDSHDLGLLAAAIAVQRQAGGNLAEVLENLAATVRERRRIRGEVKALTASATMSGAIVGVLPFGLAAYQVAVSADFRERMLGTQLGNLMLGFAFVWTVLGFLISQKMTKVEY